MSNRSGNGVSSMFLLFLVFLVLKLTGYVTWSWWWVTAPLWLGFAVVLVLVFAIALLTHYACDRRATKRWNRPKKWGEVDL